MKRRTFEYDARSTSSAKVESGRSPTETKSFSVMSAYASRFGRSATVRCETVFPTARRRACPAAPVTTISSSASACCVIVTSRVVVPAERVTR